MDQSASIKSAIENLAAKKQLVLSEEAVHAKEEYDKRYANLSAAPSEASAMRRQGEAVVAFSDSVALLREIFRASHFDELALFISKPGQMVLYQFFLGIARGLGFGLAVLLIIAMITAFSGSSLLELILIN